MPEPLTDADLDRLDALAAEATPGPWYDRSRPGDRSGYVCADLPPKRDGAKTVLILCSWLDDFPGEDAGERQNRANAAFLAAIRNAFPRLVAELRAVRAELAGLREAARRVLDAERGRESEIGCYSPSAAALDGLLHALLFPKKESDHA